MLPVPCTPVRICSVVLKTHLDRWTEFCGKGLVWSHAGLLPQPLKPVADYSERRWALQGYVEMVTGQAENRPMKLYCIYSKKSMTLNKRQLPLQKEI